MVRPQYTYTNLYDFIKFLNTAVGYLEKDNGTDLGDFTEAGKIVNAGYNNYTVYWPWYKEFTGNNYQAQAYCAGAVSTMLANGFGLEKAKKLLCGNLFSYCPDGYNQFNKAKRIFTTPKSGDVVFFWSDSLGRWSHTGLVIIVDPDGSGYTTWEANTSSGNDTVVRNGGATCRKHYTIGGRKVAFGRPDYEGNGISLTGGVAPKEMETFDIGISGAGLLCVCDSTLNVRQTPGNGTIIGCIKKGSYIVPTKKTFVNGKAWYYVPAKKGWCSASYFTGWVQEKSDNNNWWYMLPGYKWYVDQIAIIDGDAYYFLSNGYMLQGQITLKTDENGVLKRMEN